MSNPLRAPYVSSEPRLTLQLGPYPPSPSRVVERGGFGSSEGLSEKDPCRPQRGAHLLGARLPGGVLGGGLGMMLRGR